MAGLTEKQFLIKRALAVFCVQYNRKLEVEDCVINSIAPDAVSDRGYEITTPEKSATFRLRYYFRFSDVDRMSPIILEANPSYRQGELGDEVYVLHGEMDKAWRWMGPYKFDPFADGGIPNFAILTEVGIPISNENGAIWVTEVAR